MATWALLRSSRVYNSNFSSYRNLFRNDKIGIIRSFSSKTMPNDHIGIDFGSTNSCVAVMDGKNPKVIAKFPSVVAFNDKGELLLGSQAKYWAQKDPKNTVFWIKRLMAKKFDDQDIQKEKEIVPYNIVRSPGGDAWVVAGGRVYSPAQIGSYILSKLKMAAESFLGKSVSKAVITVPTEWDDEQFRVIMQASLDAGLDVQVYANSTLAAAISCGWTDKEGLIVVVDFGGRTIDVSIVEALNGQLSVRAFNVETSVGGVDFDNALVDYMVNQFKEIESIDLGKDMSALERLREAAEKAKIELSSALETDVNLPSIYSDDSGPKHLNFTLTRSNFEWLAADLIERTRSPCESCLKKLAITAEDLDDVLLVGGMASSPMVQKIVAEIFGRHPSTVANPDEVVALGAAAAIQAGLFPDNIFEQFPR